MIKNLISLNVKHCYFNRSNCRSLYATRDDTSLLLVYGVCVVSYWKDQVMLPGATGTLIIYWHIMIYSHWHIVGRYLKTSRMPRNSKIWTTKWKCIVVKKKKLPKCSVTLFLQYVPTNTYVVSLFSTHCVRPSSIASTLLDIIAYMR